MSERKKTKRKWRFRRPRRLTNVAILPTLITLGNLICGAVAIFHTANGFALATMKDAQAHVFYEYAAWFILLGMVFDALDGRVARLTKTASSFGAQLDSLCDLVTFGLAPAFLVFSICTVGDFAFTIGRLVWVVCILYAVCAAVRLARFNIETTTDLKSHMDFSGLPSPAAAGVIAAAVIPWTAYQEWAFLDAISHGVLTGLPFIMLILAVLMVSRIGFVHVLNKLFKEPRPFLVLVEVMLVGVIAILFHEFAVFLAFAGYAISGPIGWLRQKFKKKTPTEETAPQEESLF